MSEVLGNIYCYLQQTFQRIHNLGLTGHWKSQFHIWAKQKMRGKALLWSSSVSVYHYWSLCAQTSNCCFLCTDVSSLRLLTADTSCPDYSSPPVPYVLNIWRIWISEGRKLQPSLSFYSKRVCVLVLSLFPSCQFQDPSWTGHSRAHEVNRLHTSISAKSNQLTSCSGKDIFFLTLAFIYMFTFWLFSPFLE